jgi:hypothetical protein
LPYTFPKEVDLKSQFSLVALCLSLALCWESGLPVYSPFQASDDPRPSNAVEAVVEFGNALYQDVVDRYVAGKEISPDELRQV